MHNNDGSGWDTDKMYLGFLLSDQNRTRGPWALMRSHEFNG